jgi:hypothetical protein
MANLAKVYALVTASTDSLNATYTLADLGFADAVDYMTSVYPVADPGALTLQGYEIAALTRFYYNEFKLHTDYRDVLLMPDKFAQFVSAALLAKSQIGGIIGSVSNGSLIPQHLRAVTIYAQTGAQVQNWLKGAVTAGWNTSVFNINLNTATSGSTVLSPQNRVSAIILAIADFGSAPKITEIQFKDQAGVPLGVKPIPLIHAPPTQAGLGLWELNPAIFLPKNALTTIDINFEASGTSIPQLVGAQFVTREYITTETT